MAGAPELQQVSPFLTVLWQEAATATPKVVFGYFQTLFSRGI